LLRNQSAKSDWNAEGVSELQPGVVATPGKWTILGTAPLKEVAKDIANAYGVRNRVR